MAVQEGNLRSPTLKLESLLKLCRDVGKLFFLLDFLAFSISVVGRILRRLLTGCRGRGNAAQLLSALRVVWRVF